MFAPILRFEAQSSDTEPFAVSPPRSFGAIDLEFRNTDGATRAWRAYQQGVMRVRFPNVPKGDAPEAVLINTAGGLTGGDCVSVGVAMTAQTRAVITTQAHEKVYRSSAGDVSMLTTLRVEDGAALEWLPQPTILFDGARLVRETHVALTGAATFLGVEAVIFGRTAMNEAVTSGALSDRWTITRDGRLNHADRFVVAGDVAAQLQKPSVLAGHTAMATIRHIAPHAEARLTEIRDLLGDSGAASAWNGLLLARVVAPDGYRLGMALAKILTGLRGRALPPVWQI